LAESGDSSVPKNSLFDEAGNLASKEENDFNVTMEKHRSSHDLG
jgi:hypothetical protein